MKIDLVCLVFHINSSFADFVELVSLIREIRKQEAEASKLIIARKTLYLVYIIVFRQ